MYLEKNHGFTEEKNQALTDSLKTDIEDAVQTYLNSEPQTIESIFNYHYAETPSELSEQCAIAKEEVNHA